MESPEQNFQAIAAEILEMRRIDQEMRAAQSGKIIDKPAWDKNVDRTNTEKLKQIIATIGWPTISKVGEKASEGAWLLAQHADHDIKFQKDCLRLMSVEPESEVSEIDIAYLHDRICVNEGRPQFYGTQFYTNYHGAYGPREIEQAEKVDERRKAIGLDSLSDYKKRLEEKYKNFE
jgi:hypothetical protein